MHTFRLGAIAPAGLLFLAPLLSFATPITGELNITGDAVVTANSLSFMCDIGGVPCSPGTSGAVHVTALSSGDFQQFGNETGVIQNLDLSSQPVDTPLSFTNWITFNVPSPNVSVTLTRILPGVYGQADCLAPAAAGQTCTPIITDPVSGTTFVSPFNLANTVSGSSASFSVEALAVNTVTGEESKMLGIFSNEFSNLHYQDNLAKLFTGGSVTSPFSANFTVVIPEPASWSFMIGGLMVLGACLLRRAVRGQN